MSDNEDLLGDDLGDHSLADYNLGNEEEEQLLADDYDSGSSQNVPPSIGAGFSDSVDIDSTEYPRQNLEYIQPVYMQPETECVVPNITVEVPNTPQPEHSTYAPYSEPAYGQDHAVVPPPIPAAPVESPQIVPSEVTPLMNTEVTRHRVPQRVFPHRAPLPRNIPDSLDKVFVPRNAYGGRGRNSWRNPQYRQNHPYRRNNVFRANFMHRPSFPPPQIRQKIHNPPQIRPEIPTEIRPELPQVPREISPERPIIPQEGPTLAVEQPITQSERPVPPETQLIPPEQSLLPSGRLNRSPERISVSSEIHIMTPEKPTLHPEKPILHNERTILNPERPNLHPELPVIIHSDQPATVNKPSIFYIERSRLRQERPIPPPEKLTVHPDQPILDPERPIVHAERPIVHPERPIVHPERPIVHPERPIVHPDRPLLFPDRPLLHSDRPIPPGMEMENQNFPRYQFRNEERYVHNIRPNFSPNVRPSFERPMYYRPFNPRQFGPPVREVIPNNNIPQVTIRQPLPPMLPAMKVREREPEVRMFPVLPPNLPNIPPGGLAGKKVLINPHFKGNFQPPVEGLPAYIPTRIQKSPPLSPTLESKFGPIKDLDDAAERFIAEQRNALARAAGRKFARRSPQRYIENTTIEIENDLARGPPPVRRRSEDEDLLRRQEEFINANRAGLRRRMRSPTPPRRSPERRTRAPSDEDSDYRRRVREQENLRERVLRAKEVRRRKNAVALQKHLQEREKEKEKEDIKPDESTPVLKEDKPSTTVETQQEKPDTTRKTPEKEKEKEQEKRDRSPIKVESAEANSTCGENLTPPRDVATQSPERNLTPPLPKRDDKRTDSDDELHLILDDIDDILSDDDDTGRFKEKSKKVEAPKIQVDLRSKLPPKHAESRKPRQKIVFNENTDDKGKKDNSATNRTEVLSATNKNTNSDKVEPKIVRVKKMDVTNPDIVKSRQKITFDSNETETEKDDDKPKFQNRRVILQRKIQTKEKSVFARIDKNDPTKPNPGIFSRAVRTAIGPGKTRIVVKNEPTIEYESDSDIDEEKLLEECGNTALVTNLPHGMTDTRLNTLAGNDVQNLNLDKEERSAKIVFKTTNAAENFKKKFNNKMVAASRLTVTLR